MRDEAAALQLTISSPLSHLRGLPRDRGILSRLMGQCTRWFRYMRGLTTNH